MTQLDILKLALRGCFAEYEDASRCNEPKIDERLKEITNKGNEIMRLIEREERGAK